MKTRIQLEINLNDSNLSSNAFDIFLISKIKTDSSFPNSQFHLAGYRMFTYDKGSFPEGLVVHVNESIPVKQQNSYKDDSKTLVVEMADGSCI